MPITKLTDPKTFSAIVTDNWKIRRRWMKWSIFWLAGNIEAIIAWTIYAGGNALGVQLAMALIGALVGIIMFYIFGATWDDHSKRRFGLPAISGEDCPDRNDTSADEDSDPPVPGDSK
ncbi:hypothetical protein IVB12_16125 [Bradyrhizobium sp. 179]|uniref:hypothetical protein n=1 Tax=Bradyrhizobium sp. 179 TaxID=2782648 RepID=UPI001FFC0010|nr:hypothetical protein [Bradyrhizobium sp. 179]MCK1543445.1 hypothetical protein [Bradyrhizobium sp. 179]